LLPLLGRIKDLLITAGGENVAPTLVSSIEKIKKLRLLSKNEKNIFQFIKQFNF
jgi:long-subunit acyl-CoA synthetase (AMP-forming)